MSEPTKIPVYVVPAATWLASTGEGSASSVVLSRPMRVVTEHDYATLAQDVATLRAERDALRQLLTAALAVQP